MDLYQKYKQKRILALRFTALSVGLFVLVGAVIFIISQQRFNQLAEIPAAITTVASPGVANAEVQESALLSDTAIMLEADAEDKQGIEEDESAANEDEELVIATLQDDQEGNQEVLQDTRPEPEIIYPDHNLPGEVRKDDSRLLLTIEHQSQTEQNAIAEKFSQEAIAERLHIPKEQISVISETSAADEEIAEKTQVLSIQLPEHLTPEQATEQLDIPFTDEEEDAVVVRAEPNIQRRIAAIPNDPLYSRQWHHNGFAGSINTPQGWNLTTGSNSVIIAIVDTGVDIDHPDLIGNIWVNTDEIPGNGIDDDGNGYIDDRNGYDFVHDNADPNPNPDGIDEDEDGIVDGGVSHGTHVAGILGATGNNGTGVAGVMWDVQMMPVQVLDDEGAGFDSDIARGIRYAVDNGAHIINLSLGGAGSTTVLAQAVEYALGKGVIVIAAAGNSGVNMNTLPFYPVCYADVVGVGSVNADGRASAFSNYGSDCVDVSAPGDPVYSTLYTGDSQYGFTTNYGNMIGTSMATPMVSGVAGLLKSYYGTYSRAQIEQLLIGSYRSVSTISIQNGAGIVDASRVSQRLLLRNITAYSTKKRKKKLKEGFVYAHKRPHFRWSVNGNTIRRYYVYFGTSPNADPRTQGRIQTAKYYTPPKPISGDEKTYYLRVQAVDNENRLSNILTYEYVVDTVIPAPTGFTAKRVYGKRQIRLTWNKVKQQHTRQYQIFRKEKGKKWKLVKKINHPSRKWTDKKVEDGKTYIYRVKVLDDLGNTRNTKQQSARVKLR